MKRLFFAIIRFYQVQISSRTPPVCRFEPTCSNYMTEAVTAHGLSVGVWHGSLRILRCHPFHVGGYDPVPPRV
jgi:hypothetical protein